MDGNKPRNEDIEKYDDEWMKHVVSLIGCFPPYWKNIYPGIKNFNECTTTEQLKNVSRYLPYDNEGATKMVLKMHQQPCEQMRVVVSSNKDVYYKNDTLKIKLRFR